MAPPRNSPLGLMTSKVVAVPKSTTMMGALPVERSPLWVEGAAAPEDFDGGDAVDDAVGADLGGVVGEDGQAGADAGLDEEGFDVEVELDGAAQGGVERGNDGGDDHAADLGDIERAQGEEVAQDEADLVDGEGAVGGDAPVGDQSGGFAGGGEAVETEDRVGVADVDGEEHRG